MPSSIRTWAWQIEAPASNAAWVDSTCSSTVIGTAGLSAFVGTEPVIAQQIMQGLPMIASRMMVAPVLGCARRKVKTASVIIAGSIAVLFMLKPLFARTVTHSGQVSLNRGGQPLLFEFVERICDTVHAPRPTRIDVNFDINASAGYAGGFSSLFRSDLVLTIGLPLVAGLSLQQFAGVLAHEFGHFSQGAGMRVSWVIRNVNMWFARVVYSRDAWDEWLVDASEETDFRIGWIFYIARLAVFLSRGVLWCFMMLSHAATCWLSRQMEYDADRYET